MGVMSQAICSGPAEGTVAAECYRDFPGQGGKASHREAVWTSDQLDFGPSIPYPHGNRRLFLKNRSEPAARGHKIDRGAGLASPAAVSTRRKVGCGRSVPLQGGRLPYLPGRELCHALEDAFQYDQPFYEPRYDHPERLDQQTVLLKVVGWARKRAAPVKRSSAPQG